MTPVPEPRSSGRHLSIAPLPTCRKRQMKHMFATVVVVFAIAGCATGQGVATGAATSATAAPTPTTSPPGPTPSPSKSSSPSPSPAQIPDGPLAAGTYTTQPFTDNGLCFVPPQPGCTVSPADDSIRITFTLPDGWTGIEGWAVVPTVESYSPPGGAWLLFMRGGWLYSGLCKGREPDIPTGTIVDEFVTPLVDHPDPDLTSLVDVTLGGYSGKSMELQMPANVVTGGKFPPPRGRGRFVPLRVGAWDLCSGPERPVAHWVLDVDGVRVVVRSDSFPARPQRSKPNSPRSWIPSRSNPNPMTRGWRPAGRQRVLRLPSHANLGGLGS